MVNMVNVDVQHTHKSGLVPISVVGCDLTDGNETSHQHIDKARPKTAEGQP